MAKLRKTSVVQTVGGHESEPETNKYYLLISDRYMRAKYISIALLVVFLVSMMISFKDDITYANLMYLMRDINTGEAKYSATFDAVKFDEQDNMSCAIFRGELVVMGNRTLRMYNSKGEESRNYESGYSDPALVSSDKYLLAYDIGSGDYSVYTSIAKVNTGEADGKIESAHMNDKGEYVLVCRATETKYVVCSYDSSFRPIAKYYKNRYVTASAISNGGRVIIASFDSENGGSDCEIELYEDGADTPLTSYKNDGVFPLKCGFWKNGGYYVVCTDRVLFFGKNGDLLKSVEAPLGYYSYAVSEEGIALSCKNDSLGSDSTVNVFNASGELTYNNTVSGSASSLVLGDSEVYALAGDAVHRLSFDDDAKQSAVNDGGAVLLSAGQSVVICYKDGAEGLDFDKENTDAAVKTVKTTEATSENKKEGKTEKK